MGAWGPGLLENDVAADVAATFRDVLDGGGSLDEAVATVLDEWSDALDDEDGPDVALALAWLVSARGEVPAELKALALKAIRERQVLDRWRGAPEFEARQAEEQRLVEILEGRLPHTDHET